MIITRGAAAPEKRVPKRRWNPEYCGIKFFDAPAGRIRFAFQGYNYPASLLLEGRIGHPEARKPRK